MKLIKPEDMRLVGCIAPLTRVQFDPWALVLTQTRLEVVLELSGSITHLMLPLPFLMLPLRLGQLEMRVERSGRTTGDSLTRSIVAPP